MNRRTPVFLALLAGLAGLASAAEPAHTGAAESLYARLGGTSGVSAIVDATVEELAAKSRAVPGFESRDVQDIKNDLAARICSLAGGGCRNPGARRVDLASQVELVEALRVAMRAQDVPLAARNELLEALAPVRRDVASR
ncbi:MAG TPA: hypothetical protein VFV88_03795 [Steroidobacteraceae bacterium]|jgi:hemoglobin|nr:hypothetical protein [Steroidobacteraceae bacterium]